MTRMMLYSRVNPADGGGVQAVARRLALSLRHSGHSVLQGWASPDPSADEWTRCIPLPPIPQAGVPRRLRSIAGAGKALVRLARTLRRFRLDVVNYHFVTAEALYFTLLRPILGYRLVLSVHGSDVLRPKPWDAPFLGWIMSQADAITTVSRLTARQVIDEYGVDGARVTVIPNGIDGEFWSAGAVAPSPASRPPTVLSVGRLHHVKGHDVLLRAFASVAPAHPEARLVIVGDGGLRADLEALARQLGIEDRVEFPGQLDATAVRDRMSRARCFVLPSRSEGLPLVLLEAMSAGLPVIATRVGGVPEVVDETSAILVPGEDPDRMAESLAIALATPAGLVGMVERARVRAREFSAAAADDAYDAILASSVDKKSRQRSHLQRTSLR